MKDKLRLIDSICKRHPSAGIVKGWSEYTGGMKDSGQWFPRKMMDCDNLELMGFLRQLIRDENRTIPPLTEEEQKDWDAIVVKDGYWTNVYTEKVEAEHRKMLEEALFFGIDITFPENNPK